MVLFLEIRPSVYYILSWRYIHTHKMQDVWYIKALVSDIILKFNRLGFILATRRSDLSGYLRPFIKLSYRILVSLHPIYKKYVILQGSRTVAVYYYIVTNYNNPGTLNNIVW